MAESDRDRWDERYRAAEVDTELIGPPAAFEDSEGMFPSAGTALDVACGRGQNAVWLAQRGMNVVGLDVSPVAVDMATALAQHHGVSAQCRFDVADFDDGLPPGEPVDLVLCHLFREPAMYTTLIERVRAGGLLAIAVLSEVGAEPGVFRAPPGDLTAAFGHLDVLFHEEADGRAALLARV